MDVKEKIVEIHSPEPHSKKQALIMQGLQTPGVREVWVAIGTKYGKTLAASTAIVNAGMSRPNTRWRWVAPIYSQSEIGMDYIKSLLPGPPHTEVNRSSMQINMPMINTRFEFWHATKPTSLEGAGIHGYVFDEAAKSSKDAYVAARTTTSRTEGPIMLISTPLGKNWFYEGCMEAKEEMRLAKIHNRTPEKIFLTARTEENPFISKQIIENARKELPARLFRQYYLAEFMEDGAVFAGYRDCLDGPELEDLHGEHQRWFAPATLSMNVVIGVDWAKSVDYTVFTAIDLEHGRVVGFERFHKAPYTEAVRKLVLFSKKFKEVAIVLHDKTGVGSALDDQLAYTPLAYQGVTFTNASKSEMVAKLITSIEQKTIKLPRWPVLTLELDAFEVTTNAIGLMSYSAPSGKHDDAVCSLMLAHQAWLQYGDRDQSVHNLDDLKAEIGESSLEKYYRELADDDE